MANQQSADFKLGNSLFGVAKLTKKSDFHKYKLSQYFLILNLIQRTFFVV